MKKLIFTGQIASSELNDKCFIQNDIETSKSILKESLGELYEDYSFERYTEVEPVETFEFSDLKIFSHIKGTKLTFTDHLTGLRIGHYDSKEDLIKDISEKLGAESYTNTIKEMIMKYGITPAYKIELLHE